MITFANCMFSAPWLPLKRALPSWTLPILALLLSAFPLAATGITQVACGGLGQNSCGDNTPEYHAMNGYPFAIPLPVHRCDFGLRDSGGTCVNDTREGQRDSGTWAQWALDQQRNKISADLPLNRILTLGTHNSYSNEADNDQSLISTNQYYSMTDQLNLGARHLRLDPTFYYDQLRLCHGDGATLCETLAGLSLSIGGPINNRLYAYAVREIAEWLRAHPQEVITLELHAEPTDRDPELLDPLTTNFGSLIYSFDDLKSFILSHGSTDQWGGWSSRFPTLTELRSMGKRVLIYSDHQHSSLTISGNIWDPVRSTTVFIGDVTVYPGQTGKAPVPRNPDFAACRVTSTDTVPGYLQQHSLYSVRTSDGRSGSDRFGPSSTGILNEVEVAVATGCGMTSIDLDFFMKTGDLYDAFNGASPDRRREASIWSWKEGDYGNTAGPTTVAALEVSSGRWISAPMPVVGTTAWFACAIPTVSGGYTQNWFVVPANVTNTTNWFTATSACQSRAGSSATFSYPVNALDNGYLLQAAVAAQASSVYLNYTAGTRPPPPPSPPAAVTLSLNVPSQGPSPVSLQVVASSSGNDGNLMTGTVTISEILNPGPNQTSRMLTLTPIHAQPNTTVASPAVSLSDGIHLLQASYSGDSHFLASVSSPVMTSVGTCITIRSNPSGLPIVIDSNSLHPVGTPAYECLPRGNHWLYASGPIFGSGARYDFINWVGGVGTSPNLQITVGSTPATYTSIFAVSYRLDTSTTGGGTINVVSGTLSLPGAQGTGSYYPDTTTVTATPVPNAGYYLTGFYVDNHVVSSNPATITMNGAHTVQADFALQQTPVITWLPLDINAGTALGPIQLGAGAWVPGTNTMVPGTFVYTPPPGTVLPVGDNQTLSVTFTPSNSTFRTVTATTHINVKPAGAPILVVTPVLGRDGSNNVVVSLTLINTGQAAATKVTLTTALIGTTAGTPIPQSLPDIRVGGLGTATVTFPASAGARLSSTRLTLGGVYSGIPFNTTADVILP